MRSARSLFLSAVSYITRRYLDVTTITAISAIEIGKGLSIHYKHSPLLSVVIHLTFNSVVPSSGTPLQVWYSNYLNIESPLIN